MAEKAKTYREVPCPFCSLICDDLVVIESGSNLTVDSAGCAKAKKLFERKEPVITPMVNGKEVTLEKAIRHAAALIGESKAPLFSGSATDMAGSSELLALAEKCNAIVDHAHGESMISNIKVIQNHGAIMTTFSELKNRADTIILVGTDTKDKYPRFFERFIWNQSSVARLGKNKRNIVFIGENLDTRYGRNPGGERALNINCSKKMLNEYLSVLQTMLNGGRFEPDILPAADIVKLKKLVKQIKSSDYGVFVWDPAELHAKSGDMTVHLIASMTRQLNVEQRFAGLSLSGNNGANSFSSVCSWQTGFPLRVKFDKGAPRHDIKSYGTDKLVGENANDLLLWISSFDTSLSRPRTVSPTIVLSRPSVRAAREADVFIPVATPGLDHAGNLVRADSAVSLRMKKLRELGLPSCANVLKAIVERV